MNRAIPWTIAVITLVILFWRSQCNPVTENDGDTAKRRVADSAIIATRAKYADSIASLAKQVHINDSARNAQTVAYNNATHSLEDKDQSIQYWRAKYRTAREGRDTELVFIACDSINAKYAVIRVEADWWHHTADSLQLNATQRRVIDSAALQSRDSTIGALFASVKTIQGQRDAALKKAKRGKWLWFGMGAAAGGLVGHSIK